MGRRIFDMIEEKQVPGKIVITCLSCNTDIIVNEKGGKFLPVPDNMMVSPGGEITDETLLWSYVMNNHICGKNSK